MHDDKLAECIDDTIKFINDCVPVAPRFDMLNNHLEALLKIQKNRAEQIGIAEHLGEQP